MPAIEIDYSEAQKTIQSKDESPIIISTPLGNVLLEIQGELVLPSSKPQGLTPEGELKYVTIDDINHAARVGKLELNGNKATLYIGTSQRLLGEVKQLRPPLGVLKFPNEFQDGAKVKMVDVIKNKVIFSGRPLPIM
ncbi:Chromosome transmission fidelity protein 8 [Wickerhamomyces ciferrii]|uniref:Chromosome transmission fidelity protein 8 n=1 Tax=Wickerhamomyces ciferrii (strain ATCC 14091 / BCRC 22168 / CBS 111 / JCM 3599 / NBRC 0793 / NRRL Y-1031 F-60-10) TaxID=1206466 RepID=K0KSU8_WICCF|nr:Chromosome transmission fidelity protein 8 [Wickerhamomyces ciferrii]CCH44408.1 Chromosome transmission fidelity protein 8 [Wickerhamomyces ciferrii]